MRTKREKRHKFLPLLNYWFGKATVNIAIGVLAAFLSFWLLNTRYSDACLKLQTTGTIAESLARSVVYQKDAEDRITAMGTRLEAQWVGNFLYNEDQSRRFSIATGRLGNKPVSQTFGWLKIKEGDRITTDIYLEQLEAHKQGECWIKDSKDLPEGLLKQQIEVNKIELTISCPIVAENGEVFGYVAFGFNRILPNYETVAESIRASPMFTFDSNYFAV